MFRTLPAFAPLALLTLLPSAAAAGTDTARDLVRESLHAMAPHRDLHALAGIRRSGVVSRRDIVEFDHPDPPYVFAGAARTTLTDDLRNDRRLSVEQAVQADAAAPARTMRRTLTAKVEATTLEMPGGRRLQATQEAPPCWQMDEPIRALLQAERAPDLQREKDARLHGIPQHVVHFHQGHCPVRLFLDAASGLPSAIETRVVLTRATSSDIAWNAWGDLVDRVELMNYQLTDGVRYPIQADRLRNGVRMQTLALEDVRFPTAPIHDPALASAPSALPAPQLRADDLALGQAVSMAPDPGKPIAEIAPGIVQIPGSWYSTIVRQDDGLVILDAPISAGYSKRVLAEAARRFPGLPVKAVITSTGFYWHIAGVREYAARGIPIYARDRNVPVLRALLAAPHTLAPDDLARHPRKPDIRPVSAPTRIGTGRHAIVVMPVREGEQPMVMSWIADARLLHSAEMVQPLGPHGALLYPESLLELRHSVRAAGIPTRDLRLIGMHMSPTPWKAVLQTLHADAND